MMLRHCHENHEHGSTCFYFKRRASQFIWTDDNDCKYFSKAGKRNEDKNKNSQRTNSAHAKLFLKTAKIASSTKSSLFCVSPSYMLEKLVWSSVHTHFAVAFHFRVKFWLDLPFPSPLPTTLAIVPFVNTKHFSPKISLLKMFSIFLASIKWGKLHPGRIFLHAPHIWINL